MTAAEGTARWQVSPPMPDGFTDQAAWDAIHWKPSVGGSLIDDAVIAWQRENQERCNAAALAAVRSGSASLTDGPHSGAGRAGA